MEPMVNSDHLLLRSLRVVLIAVIVFTLGTGNTYPVLAQEIRSRLQQRDQETRSGATFALEPPVADAGGPYAGRAQEALTFDGSGSSGDSELAYSWDFGDGGTGTGVSPTHAYASPGGYTVTLIVSNGSVDSEPSTAKAVISVRTAQTDLGQGWSLISLPVEPLDGSLPAVLESIQGLYSSVWAYDALTGRWSAYYAVDAAGDWRMDVLKALDVDELEAMSPGVGYWIDVIQPVTLTIAMSRAADDPIPLRQGWNLTGFNSLTTQLRDDAQAGIRYDSLWEYDNASGQWLLYALGWLCPDAWALNSLDQLAPWHGYWIDSLYNVSWEVPTTPNQSPVAHADGPYQVDMDDGVISSSVTLDGSASADPDAGDSIASYTWDIDADGVFGDVTGVSPALSPGQLVSFGISGPDTYPVVLEVRDTHGANDIDASVIQVLENVPVAVAKAEPVSAAPDEAVAFHHSSSWHKSTGHSIVLYEWDYQDDSVIDYTTTEASDKPQHQYPFIPGTLSRVETAVLRVTDDNTPPKTDTDAVDIEVVFVNNAPVAEADGPYGIDLRDSIILDGSGSSDPESRTIIVENTHIVLASVCGQLP